MESGGDEEFWLAMELKYGKGCNDMVWRFRAARREVGERGGNSNLIPTLPLARSGEVKVGEDQEDGGLRRNPASGERWGLPYAVLG